VGEQRAGLLSQWERKAAGWASRADRVREFGMPVSVRMIEAVSPQPGQRLLELAAGPGDTGFLAAELLSPGGVLLCSDGAEAMLEVARGRAASLGIGNVQFKLLELEWIDLPAATVDAVLCRWGLMLVVDPEAALREVRRILRPGGRAAIAVWDAPDANPWARIPTQVLVSLGHAEPPDPSAPGMFALADAERLRGLFEATGFADVSVEPVAIERTHDSVEAYLEETLALSPTFPEVVGGLEASQRAAVWDAVAVAAAPFTASDGRVTLPGRSLVAAATA
jgi:ubiquinone/menaquinone biosynthesis C-methylase UbiE